MENNEEMKREVRSNHTLNDFATAAMSTLTQPCDNFTYALTGMTAEVGEINDKVAKWRRKGEAFIKDDELVFNTSDLVKASQYRRQLALEVFDVMWFCALMSEKLGMSLQEVANMGLAKLKHRAETDTIVTHEDH